MVIGVTWHRGNPCVSILTRKQPFRRGEAVFGIGTEAQLDRLRVIIEG